MLEMFIVYGNQIISSQSAFYLSKAKYISVFIDQNEVWRATKLVAAILCKTEYFATLIFYKNNFIRTQGSFLLKV